MLFDKLRNILTTGLSFPAEELQNLLNVERIVIRLVIQVLIELPCQDRDVFCRVHLGIPPFDQVLFTEIICGLFGDLTIFLEDVEKDNIVQHQVQFLFPVKFKRKEITGKASVNQEIPEKDLKKHLWVEMDDD